MNISIDFDRTSAALRGYSAFAPASSSVASLKGTLKLSLSRDRSLSSQQSSISMPGEIFPLLQQWLESVTALQDTPGSQHTIFCENGGVILERRGGSVEITFDPSLCLSPLQATEAPPDKTTLRVPFSKVVRATLRATAEFCTQLLAINSALEHFEPVQVILRLYRKLKEEVESRRGLAGILHALRSGSMVSFDHPWKWAAGAAAVILIWQMHAFNAKLSRLQTQILSQQSVSASATEDSRQARPRLGRQKDQSESASKRRPSGGQVTIGIPGAEPAAGKAGEASEARQSQARLAGRRPDAPPRDLVPPLAALIGREARSLSSERTSPAWKLAGIIEYQGERTAVLEQIGQNPQEKTTVYKKAGEPLGSGGWAVSEVQADRVVLIRKKPVRPQGGTKHDQGPKPSIERLTLTIGQ